jgi:transposase
LLFENEGLSITQLSLKFEAHRDTIRKWINRDSPFDKSPPKGKKRVVTPEYEQAVIKYQIANPTHEARTIAVALQAKFPCANRKTIAFILKENGLTKKPILD